MAIAASVILAQMALRAAFDAATPIESAPPLLFAALRDKARDLVVILDAETVTTGSPLDVVALPAEIQAIPAALINIANHNADESVLCDLRSLAGRVRTNINLSVG